MSRLWLNDDELIELTGYRRRDKQRVALAQMGVKFRSRPSDGFPLVERWQFEGDGKLMRKERRTEPNWGALEKLGNQRVIDYHVRAARTQSRRTRK